MRIKAVGGRVHIDYYGRGFLVVGQVFGCGVGGSLGCTDFCSRELDTVFPRIDAAAFIYFVGQFGAATIRGRRLFEGGVYSFRQYDLRRVLRLRPQHPAEVLSTSR